MWDATCPDTLAPSHIHLAVREAEAVAEEAEKKKHSKYSQLSVSHNFVPIAVESMSTLGPEAQSLFRELGHRLISTTSEPLAHHYFVQRVAMAVQQGNAVAVLGTAASFI